MGWAHRKSFSATAEPGCPRSSTQQQLKRRRAARGTGKPCGALEAGMRLGRKMHYPGRPGMTLGLLCCAVLCCACAILGGRGAHADGPAGEGQLCGRAAGEGGQRPGLGRIGQGGLWGGVGVHQAEGQQRSSRRSVKGVRCEKSSTRGWVVWRAGGLAIANIAGERQHK